MNLPFGITQAPDGKFVTPSGVYDTLDEAVTAMNISQPAFAPRPEPAMAQPVSGTMPAGMPQQQQPAMPQPQQPAMPAMPTPNSVKADPSFLDRLTSKQGIGAIGAGMLGMSNDPNLQQFGMAQLGKMQNRSTTNRTVQKLREMGRDDLADGVESGLLDAKTAASLIYGQPKDSRTALQKDFEYARAQGYGGDFQQFMKDKGAGVNVNVGGEGTSELDKTLQKATGTRFNTYLQAGDSAAALIPELRMLEQLANTAPSGPLQGRLAEMFPEANDASAAFMSMVQRLAPTMRVEGSGSTSDTEFNAMLRSLGSLRNSPEANSMIYDAFRRKAVLDQARAEIVRMYQSKQLTLDEAQQKLGKLNAERILSDDLRTMIDPDSNMAVEIPEQAPQNLPAGVRDLWPSMTDAQKRKFL